VAAGASVPQEPESVGLAPGEVSGRSAVLASGSDARGLVYALLELTDRVRLGSDPLAELAIQKPVVERPANRIRSVARAFVSDVEDKPWFNDRAMWPEYLSMLAAQRFNRFSLTLGIGYDAPNGLRDTYFYFAYPFLVSVPGYNVRASGLPDAERDRNLEMLRFISDEAEARGLHFQLGLWTHAFQWQNSPRANYVIEGLAPERQGAYCRDALYAVLTACPSIRGVTFRIHGESGVAEGSYELWRTIFEGIVKTGRHIEIDMHAKGMDFRMIAVALSTGMPVNVSPKYWAEHMGLSYHQAAIRELEMPRRDRRNSGFYSLSSGARSFLRYGYGDLLMEDRRHGVLHRLWPGTQRLLLWGDPLLAAGYGRISSFCGSAGMELCEPLFFKGRKGTGLPGGRCAYADPSLKPRWDWEKYMYTYRVWGRLLYNPEAEPETWQRQLRNRFQAAAPAVERALSSAGRILPLFTTAHGISGANNDYWPEVYTNLSTAETTRRQPYTDTPEPRRTGTASPFDPELFLTVDATAAELLKGERSGKYTSIEVALWLEDFANAAARHLAEAEKSAPSATDPEWRRMAIDVRIQAGLGRFFAGKLRASVLYGIHRASGDKAALEQSIRTYRAGRVAWAETAELAKGVYVPDITVGERNLRGHWLDRLAAFDQDIADLEQALAKVRTDLPEPEASHARQAVSEALGRPLRAYLQWRHTSPSRFQPGAPLAIELSVQRPQSAVRLHYRHVNQSERYEVVEMEAQGSVFRATIPGDYTNSPYPLEYYLTVHDGTAAWLIPGFDASLTNQPYFVVRRA
jgi:hypothetical protein